MIAVAVVKKLMINGRRQKYTLFEFNFMLPLNTLHYAITNEDLRERLKFILGLHQRRQCFG